MFGMEIGLCYKVVTDLGKVSMFKYFGLNNKGQSLGKIFGTDVVVIIEDAFRPSIRSFTEISCQNI